MRDLNPGKIALLDISTPGSHPLDRDVFYLDLLSQGW